MNVDTYVSRDFALFDIIWPLWIPTFILLKRNSHKLLEKKRC